MKNKSFIFTTIALSVAVVVASVSLYSDPSNWTNWFAVVAILTALLVVIVTEYITE